MTPEKKISVFRSVADTYRAMNLPASKIDDRLGFTINNLRVLHPDLPFKSVGYRPNYFSFLFVKDGEGRYTTDDKSFETCSGTIYFTNPGHYKSFEWSRIDEIYLVTFTESFLKENIHREVFRDFPFLLAETVQPKILELAVFAEFEEIYLLVEKTFHSDSPKKARIIGNLFAVILLKIQEYFWRDYDPVDEGTRGSQIVKQFRENLEQHYRQLHERTANSVLKVRDYADRQNLHPNYLSVVVKSKTGKSISSWIAEKNIAEAKTLLKNSSMSIKEIAYLLGFSDASHFNNYFKKYTRSSPGEYRKSPI